MESKIELIIRDVNMTITLWDKDEKGVFIGWDENDDIDDIMSSELRIEKHFIDKNDVEIVNEETTNYERDFRWIKHILPENWKKGEELCIGLDINTDYCACLYYTEPADLPFLKIGIDGYLYIHRYNIHPNDLTTTYEKCNCKYNFEVESKKPKGPKICPYVIKRGAKKGQICGSKYRREGSYCYKHRACEKK